jgi:malto-oligosyltrehalose trehalohydrolase
MVLLDVVYNHFGPEGNYLPLYATAFFNPAHQTPWGSAINFDGRDHFYVRDFFVHNALYWIEEYHVDGLRVDAVHAIADDSPVHIAREIASAIAMGPGTERHIHLVLENEKNEARLLEGEAPHATAQWNDAAHHALHVLLTGESHGYYAGFTRHTVSLLGQAIGEGFAPLPYERFVNFLQNHDQVGNRALGDRLCHVVHDREALRLAVAALLLSPSIPLLFMGEEFGAATPFQYFCDYEGDLADAVRKGRRNEFDHRDAVPDPIDAKTFLASKLDWSNLGEPGSAAVLAHYREMIALRAREIVPRLDGRVHARHFDPVETVGLQVHWMFGDSSRLAFHGNFSRRTLDGFTPVPGAQAIHLENGATAEGPLPPWGGRWLRTAP